MLTFDFGRSDADDSAIARRLQEGAGPSLSLTVPLFVLGLVVGVLLALFVAFFRETYIDRAVLVLCMLTMSIASLLYIIAGQYLVGMLLQVVPDLRLRLRSAVVAGRFLALPVLVGVVVRLWRRRAALSHHFHRGDATATTCAPPAPRAAGMRASWCRTCCATH